ncbi:MAG: arsenosugar biosynthesis radical SAM protein ArsS [Deltaproteobacteria bacterium]|nr:arsenosugar biosynthesis radical SAM protein ArsS [Deltaproteobacteria bacterium]
MDELKDVPAFGQRDECRRFSMTRPSLEIMQINIGKRCNLTCKHCHVKAGPNRAELMSRDVMESCLQAFESNGFQTLDITGGAPEMNPDLPQLVKTAAARGLHTIVRTNLAILIEDGFLDFPDFYAQNKVELAASLPYYSERDVDRQRGQGVFSASITALRRLNALGYGRASDLRLNLVYNPGGAFLPPDQKALAQDYRKKLLDQFGVSFNELYAITNNPIGRFGDFLDRSDNLIGYMKRLAAAFNPAAVENMMCRNQLCVDWDGRLYDCDFNLALGLTAKMPGRIQDFGGASLLREIAFGNHCYACTAGAGSSCGGATA